MSASDFCVFVYALQETVKRTTGRERRRRTVADATIRNSRSRVRGKDGAFIPSVIGADCCSIGLYPLSYRGITSWLGAFIPSVIGDRR